ncbi:hypothetical protein PAMP_012584 [Pampus punctatissimus]
MAECIKVLAPFYEATLELSEEKRVSGSKLLPILTMLHHALEEEDLGILETQESRGLTESLRRQIQDKLKQTVASAGRKCAAEKKPK